MSGFALHFSTIFFPLLNSIPSICLYIAVMHVFYFTRTKMAYRMQHTMVWKCENKYHKSIQYSFFYVSYRSMSVRKTVLAARKQQSDCKVLFKKRLRGFFSIIRLRSKKSEVHYSKNILRICVVKQQSPFIDAL